jgi:flagellar hook protein FlgE
MYYTSISGLKNAQTELNTISHNIANAETNGFKRSRVEFADVIASSKMTDPRHVTGVGSTVEAITQNFSIGPVEQTGAALDLAITGDGFFEIKPAAGGQSMYTRNGSFGINNEGFIVDASGNRLQGTAGDLKVEPKNGDADFAGITVGVDGKVQASYTSGPAVDVGVVSLSTFISPQGLKQVGSSNWVATGLSGDPVPGEPNTGANGALLAGAIEHSNVEIAEELVNLITAQRYFQANAKAIDTATQISQTIIGLRS